MEVAGPGELGGTNDAGDEGIWLNISSSSKSEGEVASALTVEQ